MGALHVPRGQNSQGDKGFLFPGEFHTPCLPSLTLAPSDCSLPSGNRLSYGAAESCVVNCPREQNLSTLASKGAGLGERTPCRR